MCVSVAIQWSIGALAFAGAQGADRVNEARHVCVATQWSRCGCREADASVWRCQ